jgi:hypothetical protein
MYVYCMFGVIIVCIQILICCIMVVQYGYSLSPETISIAFRLPSNMRILLYYFYNVTSL